MAEAYIAPKEWQKIPLSVRLLFNFLIFPSITFFGGYFLRPTIEQKLLDRSNIHGVSIEKIVEKSSEDPSKKNEKIELMCTKYTDSDWKTYNLWKKRDGFYYPISINLGFEGLFRLKTQINSEMKEIHIAYEIKPGEKSTKPPSFIFGLYRNDSEGKHQQVFHLWVPEYSVRDAGNGQTNNFLQLIGIATNKDFSTNEASRSGVIQLEDVVKTKRVDSLIVKRLKVNPTSILYDFILGLTSDKTGLAMPNANFTQELFFPYSNLIDSGEVFYIEFGTYVGHSIKISNIEVCY